jgi:hypothetical protein
MLQRGNIITGLSIWTGTAITAWKAACFLIIILVKRAIPFRAVYVYTPVPPTAEQMERALPGVTMT